MVQLVIHEDIFAPVLQGEITLFDNIGLFDYLPISGNEKLTVQFYSYGYSPDHNENIDFIWRTFDILMVTNVTAPNDYTKRYTLVFASPELKLNECTMISKAWGPNVTISNVVASIMTGDNVITNLTDPAGLGYSQTPNPLTLEYTYRSPFLTSNDVEQNYVDTGSTANATEVFVEKTKTIEPYIAIPYMKPFEAIKWMASRAIRNCAGLYPTTVSANFLFFENKRGFQFVSLTTLLENKQGTLPKFQFGDAKQNLDPVWKLNRIETLRIEDCYNILSNINNGVYASRLFTYEMSTGVLTTNDFDYLKQFPLNESMDRSAPPATTKDFPQIAIDAAGTNPLTQMPLAKRMLIPVSHIRTKDNTTGADSTRFNSADTQVGAEQYLQARMSQLAKLGDFRVLVEVAANSEHKVGDLVELDLKMWNLTNATPELGEIAHKYYSGNYLITSIRHVLTNFEYKMHIEMVKDSLLAQIGPVPTDQF